MAANVEVIPEEVGTPAAVLADSAYACEEEVVKVGAPGVEVYVSTGAESKRMERQHDFRPTHLRKRKAKTLKAPWLVELGVPGVQYEEALEPENGYMMLPGEVCLYTRIPK